MRTVAFGLAVPVLAFVVAAPADARTRTVNCGIVCQPEIDCGRHLQPTCTSGGACDAGFVSFTLPDPYVHDCPGFPCSGGTQTFTAGCYDPQNPPTCNQCSGPGQYQCVPSTGCGGLCDAGLTPSVNGFCVPCGSVGEPICEDGGATCDGGLVIAGGECWSNCGGAGQLECGNGHCQDWHFSTLGICAACGGDPGSIPGIQAVCPSSPFCRPNVEQQGVVCVNCGQDQEPECELGGACREPAEPIGEDSGGHAICAICGGWGEVACLGSAPCDPGYYHATTGGLDGPISACVGGGETGHFADQNGICSLGPETMARPAPEAWPAAEEPAAGRNTVLILHGRGSSCGGSMDNVLDAGGVYDAGHLTYCVEYAQQDAAPIDRRAVRILPVLDDVQGNPQPTCTATADCEFDETDLVAEALAPTFDVPGVGIALREAILRMPIEGDITLIGHSQGGFIARELVYRHYDALRWAGKRITRVIVLGHPFYAKQIDPHLYTPWLCAEGDSFDCAVGRWVWGWDLNAPGSINESDFPQIDWTAVSGGGFLGGASAEDTDGDGDVEDDDLACQQIFGGVSHTDVLGDSSVPIESSLGYDEFGFFAAQELPLDRKVHSTCTHTAACLMAQAQFDPAPCHAGGGIGSPPDSCHGEDAVPSVLPYSTDRLRTPDVLDFDGVDDHVRIDDPAALAALDMGSSMTLEAWVLPQGPGPTSVGSVFINKEGEYWLGRWGDGRVAWAVADGNWVARLSSFVLPDGEWAHVALTFDGAGTGFARLYVNGMFREQWAVGASVGDVSAEDRLDIGLRSGGGQPLDGRIDDVRIWNRALTASQVASVLGGVVPSLGFDPVAWWRFDEAGDTILDSSGNGFHGSISQLGASATPVRRRERRTDKKGGALYLDGVDDRAIVDDPAATARLEVHDELTIEGWMFLRSYDFATMLLQKEGEYWLAVSPTGHVGFAIASTSPGWVGVYGSYQMPLRTWTHVAFVYDNDPGSGTATARLYVDGQFRQLWVVAGSIGDVNAGDDRLGLGDRAGGGQTVHGVIDEVRVWNVARTAAEIAASYNRTLAAPAPGLVGYWDFDEGHGPIVFDRSGLGNHARLGVGTVASRPYRSMAPHLPGFRLIYAADCGNGFVDPSEDCDDAGAFGGDGCSAACRAESVFEVMGQPQGGSVSIEVMGVTIAVTTAAGQTAADVATALAAAINSHAALATLGITATSAGDQVFLGGDYSNPVITDPGLMDCSTQVAFPLIDGDLTNACPDTAVLLSTDDGFAEYQWLYEGQPISGATASSYVATVTGAYAVRVGDGSGCERDSYPELTLVTFCSDTEVSPPGAVFPLRIDKDAESPTGYYATFQHVDGADGFHVYTGTLGVWYDHGGGGACQLEACAVPGGSGCFDDLGTGEVRIALTPGAGREYYLVTAYQGTEQGPAGHASSGAPRDPAQETCLP